MSTATAAQPQRHHPATYGAGAHIVCDNLIRIYRTDKVEVVALQGLDLLVDRGELVAVIGASGSGKSTLLNILSGLDQPTAGLCRVGDQDLLEMSGKQRLRYRRHVVGFVWQQTARNLVPYLSVCDNVLLPLLASRTGRDERHERVEQLLGLLGVADVRDRRPGELSGGQQQRVSIAVALANRPEVLLADEPTGELDSRTAEEVFGALQRVNTELGVTVVVVTHDAGVSEHVGRTVGIRDGRTSSEVLRHDTGHEGLVAQEYAVLDRVGRLQLPQEFTSALQMDRRVRLELEEDHIGVWPDRPAGPEGGAS
jgi:ABC-type lipoprotein export system ATPase subunit